MPTVHPLTLMAGHPPRKWMARMWAVMGRWIGGRRWTWRRRRRRAAGHDLAARSCPPPPLQRAHPSQAWTEVPLMTRISKTAKFPVQANLFIEANFSQDWQKNLSITWWNLQPTNVYTEHSNLPKEPEEDEDRVRKTSSAWQHCCPESFCNYWIS